MVSEILWQLLEDGIPWLSEEKEYFYWGDIDTYGFALLSEIRKSFPNIQSLLMNETTLLRHNKLWGDEKKQFPAEMLENLTASERHVYRGLKSHQWGPYIRLEQERIPWDYAWKTLLSRIVRPEFAPGGS